MTKAWHDAHMSMPNPTLPLRNELLDVCRENGGTINDVAQALVDALMIVLIAAAPDVDAAPTTESGMMVLLARAEQLRGRIWRA